MVKEASNAPKQYIYFLRIMACFLVIYNHLIGYHLYELTCGPIQWVNMFITMFTRINVPLFFMISGTLLLSKMETFSEVLKKRLPRFCGILLVFCIGSYLIDYACFEEPGIDRYYSLADFFYRLFDGSVYGAGVYWYLYAYISFLLMLPFLQRIAKGMTDQDFWILIGIHFVFSSLLPLVDFFLKLTGNKVIAVAYDLSFPLANTRLTIKSQALK